MAAITADQVAEAVRPAVEGTGLFLEDVTIAPAGSRTVVRVTVDLPEDEAGSLGLDRVAEVSRLVSDTLDEKDTIPGVYTLEVSTPGTSRPLTELRHLKRARTRLVSLDLEDGTTAAGRLVEVDGETVVLDPERRIEFAHIRQGRVEVEMKRATELDEDAFVPLSSDDTDEEA